jgi:hypothetical protein
VKLLALLLLLAGVAVPAPVSEPYLVHWSDTHTVATGDDENAREWVETQHFDGEYATLAQARIIAREVAGKHYMVQSFPVEISHYRDDRLDTFELYYTGGDHVIRIRNGRVLCEARCRTERD